MPASTVIMPQFIYNLVIFNDYISIITVVFYSMLCCSALILDIIIMLMRKLASHFVPHWHDYYNYVTRPNRSYLHKKIYD